MRRLVCDTKVNRSLPTLGWYTGLHTVPQTPNIRSLVWFSMSVVPFRPIPTVPLVRTGRPLPLRTNPHRPSGLKEE